VNQSVVIALAAWPAAAVAQGIAIGWFIRVGRGFDRPDEAEQPKRARSGT
jgi:hypothetical protein